MTQPIRKVPLSHGVQWLLRAVNLGARNPRAIFGAAVLFMAVLYLLAVLLATPARSLAGSADPDMSGIATALIPMFVLLVLALPVLLAGLMHVIREAEAGRPTRARDLFAPLRQHKLSALAGVGLIQIALTLISGALVVWLAGQDYWSQYLEMLRDALRRVRRRRASGLMCELHPAARPCSRPAAHSGPPPLQTCCARLGRAHVCSGGLANCPQPPTRSRALGQLRAISRPPG
ncbi:hypothetical protein [Lysobacter firmicutimachus]|uniref:Uncharacterized protein n=1 Tax=Lysobacter firmicutimachus TaxID=1792846 RepID=A0ABU8CY42_9GAMM